MRLTPRPVCVGQSARCCVAAKALAASLVRKRAVQVSKRFAEALSVLREAAQHQAVKDVRKRVHDGAALVAEHKWAPRLITRPARLVAWLLDDRGQACGSVQDEPLNQPASQDRAAEPQPQAEPQPPAQPQVSEPGDEPAQPQVQAPEAAPTEEPASDVSEFTQAAEQVEMAEPEPTVESVEPVEPVTPAAAVAPAVVAEPSQPAPVQPAREPVKAPEAAPKPVAHHRPSRSRKGNGGKSGSASRKRAKKT